jgi:hypothetical protein
MTMLFTQPRTPISIMFSPYRTCFIVIGCIGTRSLSFQFAINFVLLDWYIGLNVSGSLQNVCIFEHGKFVFETGAKNINSNSQCE